MDTYFAPATRAPQAQLLAEIETVNESAVLNGLLRSIGGLLAILDENRQIVAVNDALLDFLGIDDPAAALGLRLGQALSCPYAEASPAGCGTTKACASCGAVIAIVASLDTDQPVERLCALKVQREGVEDELALMVRSQPIRVAERRFLLLFIQDVTDDQRRAALERTFFHDINNLLGILLGACDILRDDQPGELSRTIFQVAQNLKSEVHLQACLVAGESGEYTPAWEFLEARAVLADLERFFTAHPEARERRLDIKPFDDLPAFQSDRAALLRVLSNMALNALEATDPGGFVRVWAYADLGRICFATWNRLPIDEAIQPRIFQRNFSTKGEPGRGLGTYSMKLFGEKLLRGEVSFTSSPQEGTTFKLTLPLAPA